MPGGLDDGQPIGVSALGGPGSLADDTAGACAMGGTAASVAATIAADTTSNGQPWATAANGDCRTPAPVPGSIGWTPLIRLDRVMPSGRITAYAKLEAANPGGSIKDRPASRIVSELLARGDLVPGVSTIVESSSGNFAISLAMLSRYYGFRFICVLDKRTTTYNMRILEALGAEIVLVEHPDAETGDYLPARLRRVAGLLADLPSAVWPDQYSNPNNAAAHMATMGEIVGQAGRDLAAVLVPTSSCGTLRGCEDYLRAEGLQTELVAVDALGSAIFADAEEERMIPGHGSAITPHLCAESLGTRLLRVDNVACVEGCWELTRGEGLLVGGSSGATWAGFKQFEPELPDGAVAVLVFPDRGERYLDTVYDTAWVERHFGRDLLDKLQRLGRPATGGQR